jgi:V/A-type H+-transporting ATPase subunit F
MRMLVIGHPEAVLGFSLVGVHGQAVTSSAEANQAMDNALSASDIGIILVTEDAARMLGERMEKLKLNSTIPLIVEIPAPQSEHAEQASLSDIVRRAIGIKI